MPGPALEGNMLDMLAKEAEWEALQTQLNAILAEAVSADEELARAISMATGAEPIPETPHTNDPVLQGILSRSLPQDPEQFHDMWAQLSDQQKDFLYGQDHSIGNHSGMPFVDKNRYNRQHLTELIGTTQADVDRMQQRFDELARQAYMGDTSSTTGRELAALGPQLLAARYQLDGYRAVNDTLGKQDGAQRYLALIDDQGHAAVSIGNPDTASRTATFVPGTGQDMATFEGSDSYEMFNAALAADRSLSKDDVAVTTWMGYDRPMDLGQAAWPGRAEVGGAGLDAFIDGTHASHQGAVPAVDTVIGHSYGSTLGGGAATGAITWRRTMSSQWAVLACWWTMQRISISIPDRRSTR